MEYRISSQYQKALFKRMVIFIIFYELFALFATVVVVIHKHRNTFAGVCEGAFVFLIVSAILGTMLWRRDSAQLKALREHVMVVSDGKVRFPNGAMTVDFDLAKIQQCIIYQKQGKSTKLELKGEKEVVWLEGYERMDDLTHEILAVVPKEKVVTK
jgi:hypothetical protein